MKRQLWVLVVILLAALVLAACGGGDDDGGGGNSDNGGGSNASGADLIVDEIVMDPGTPQAGAPFVLRVFVKNQGDADASAFAVKINIRDTQRQSDDNVGTFAEDSLEAGERLLIFETTTRRVATAGNYQVQVEITPTGSDASAQNNKKNRAFSVE